MSPLATVGIISIGEMGMGIAKLLVAHNYRVVTNIEGRSQDTHQRAQKSNIELLPTDASLLSESDYILSIVPPSDALSTATRLATAFNSLSPPKSSPLYYLDLNAIAPVTARSIASHVKSISPAIKFIDGGVIGGAPKLKNDTTTPITTASVDPNQEHEWDRPSIPISGPHELAKAPISGAHLAELLNTTYLGEEIGKASGLKCCFASTVKGFTALCIQAFTSAQRLGILEELQKEMSERVPGIWKSIGGGMTGMPPKAYRWIREMEEIGMCHGETGFSGGEKGKGLFEEIADVYRIVANETVLGEEKTEKRKRGTTMEDVAQCMSEGLASKRARYRLE
ncbi:hypothetical protein DSL72_001684 [Monilinia vaccinii-corymbosi]|uniref:Phosphogluconate dehydrogenase NAD-binding putative C-terminal domain-containing protein n=1 Tax=Monilinia vaccinii-corymbosi TaxID=61207 RepID=A0A8A3P2K8_9HELO|nr:hypothetical protein DSL72_001684 [Monilinia vaccinii-corymbosi]